MNKTKCLTLAASAAMLMGLSARAADVIAYDNSTTAQKDTGGNIIFIPGSVGGVGREIGDEISLAGGANTITGFRFEYRYNGAVGPATGVLRFYDLKAAGAGAEPDDADLLLQSAPFTLDGGATGFGTAGIGEIAGGAPVAITLPTTGTPDPGRFVWTVTFSGVANGVEAGLVLYNPGGPTVGASLDDHWQRVTGGWSLFDDALGAQDFVDNFGAQVVVVPEPGTVALMVAGGLALVAARRRKTA